MLAWNTYWDSRSPVAGTLSQLETIKIGEAEASELAIKLRSMTEKMAELETREIDQQTQEMKNAGASTRNRTR